MSAPGREPVTTTLVPVRTHSVAVPSVPNVAPLLLAMVSVCSRVVLAAVPPTGPRTVIIPFAPALKLSERELSVSPSIVLDNTMSSPAPPAEVNVIVFVRVTPVAKLMPSAVLVILPPRLTSPAPS